MCCANVYHVRSLTLLSLYLFLVRLFLPVAQRERKQKKLYAEEYALGDDDTEGVRGFSVAEKLESDRFAQTGMVREMKGTDLSIG